MPHIDSNHLTNKSNRCTQFCALYANIHTLSWSIHSTDICAY